MTDVMPTPTELPKHEIETNAQERDFEDFQSALLRRWLMRIDYTAISKECIWLNKGIDRLPTPADFDDKAWMQRLILDAHKRRFGSFPLDPLIEEKGFPLKLADIHLLSDYHRNLYETRALPDYHHPDVALTLQYKELLLNEKEYLSVKRLLDMDTFPNDKDDWMSYLNYFYNAAFTLMLKPFTPPGPAKSIPPCPGPFSTAPCHLPNTPPNRRFSLDGTEWDIPITYSNTCYGWVIHGYHSLPDQASAQRHVFFMKQCHLVAMLQPKLEDFGLNRWEDFKRDFVGQWPNEKTICLLVRKQSQFEKYRAAMWKWLRTPGHYRICRSTLHDSPFYRLVFDMTDKKGYMSEVYPDLQRDCDKPMELPPDIQEIADKFPWIVTR